MRTYQTNQNFVEAMSTRKTLFGAASTDFIVSYAPIDDLANVTVVSGGMTEAVETIVTAHAGTTNAPSAYGSKILYVDGANSDIVAGDTIEYATGKFAYVLKVVGDKLYLRTPIRVSVASGSTITQVGNTGEYASENIAIAAAGEYAITIEAPVYGIVVTDRVRIVDEATSSVDADAPVETVAVAY